jgi:small conductance mechanosensitive channel
MAILWSPLADGDTAATSGGEFIHAARPMIDLSQIPSLLITIGVHLGEAILIFLVGRWLAGLFRRWASRALSRTTITPSLSELASRLVYGGTLLLTFIAILAVLGVPITAILSVSAMVIVVLGIALRESIADLAATVIFLLLQPFRIGEIVEANGVLGTVQEISLFSTVLVTFDRKVVTLPNSKIQQANIVNYTRAGVLGADVVITLPPDEDLLRAKEIMREVAAADPRVLPEPPMSVGVRALSENGVELLARPFVKSGDFFATRGDLLERIKLRFDQEGIRQAVPQRDVRVVTHEPTP